MNLLHLFKEHWNSKYSYINSTENLLIVAISGGVDSVVLAHLLRESCKNILLAHCNFNLRGEESERDEKFVQQFAKELDVELRIKKCNTNEYAIENNFSIQEAARNLRYSFFNEIRKEVLVQYQSVFIVTAHHADDNIETVLMNFFRGTGIDGLTGIPEKNEQIIRPLLNFKKEDLIKYAASNSLQYCEDSSNSSDKYSRNYFRNQIIPLVKNIYPEAEQNIVRNISKFKDVAEIYHQHIKLILKKLFIKKENEIHISILLLKKQHAYSSILYEFLKEYYFTSSQIPEIIKLLDASNGSFVKSSSHRVIKNRNWLILSSLKNVEQTNYFIIEKYSNNFASDYFELKIENLLNDGKVIISKNKHLALLNAELIEYPLIVRKWQVGDYFYPLGMKKKKKLSRFFIDQKFSLTEKENCWVILSNKKICWIVNHRIDDRFKITDSTKNILLLTVKH